MVTFDTPLLIYGIQKNAPSEQQHLVTRTLGLIRHLRDKKVQIMVPAPALSEFLVKLPPPIRNAKILDGLMAVASFNANCAQVAADLQADGELMKHIREEAQISRQCLKVDTMIVATAIAYRANSVYTNDINHFLKIAQGKIPVQAIPNLSSQQDLF